MQHLLVRGTYLAESQVPVPLPDLPVRRRTSIAGSAGLAASPLWVAGVVPFKVMFIPACNFEPEARLPPVRMDIFYHRRVLDMPGRLPKYSGYYPSLLAGSWENDHDWRVKWRVKCRSQSE